MALTFSELADALGLKLVFRDREAQGGLAERLVAGVSTLEAAGPDEVSFFANPRYQSQLEATRAGAVIIDEAHAQLAAVALVSPNPYLDFVRAVAIFAKPQGCLEGVSELAFVHPEAEVAQGASVYPFVFVGARARVEAGVTLFPGVYVGEDCVVGTGSLIYPNAVLMAGTRIGQRVVVHPGAVVGSDGFGFAQAPTGLERFPQIGRVVIADDVEVGANSAVDRAALGETRIGQGTKIDNLVQIGHNVQVGEGAILISQVGVAGSAKIGDRVVLAGQVGVAGHLTIGDGARVAAKSGIPSDLEGGKDYGGIPTMEASVYRRYMAAVPRLPELLKRVRRLEQELDKLRRTTSESGED